MDAKKIFESVYYTTAFLFIFGIGMGYFARLNRDLEYESKLRDMPKIVKIENENLKDLRHLFEKTSIDKKSLDLAMGFLKEVSKNSIASPYEIMYFFANISPEELGDLLGLAGEHFGERGERESELIRTLFFLGNQPGTRDIILEEYKFRRLDRRKGLEEFKSVLKKTRERIKSKVKRDLTSERLKRKLELRKTIHAERLNKGPGRSFVDKRTRTNKTPHRF